MAGHRTIINGTVCFIDYADAEGTAVINGKTWRWEFHEYCGPLFLRNDGRALKNQNPPRSVWDAFEKWHAEYRSRKPLPAPSRNRIKLEFTK